MLGKKILKIIARNLHYDLINNEMNDGIYEKTFSDECLKSKGLYNVGAGSFSHNYWTNIDYQTDSYRQVQKPGFINFDLMSLKPLPIDDDSAEFMYSSHTIEHISDEAVQNLLNECHRVLKKGGGVRLTTPNASLEYAAYLRNDLSYWKWSVDRYSKPGNWEKLYTMPLNKASIHQVFLHHFASQVCNIDADNSASKKFSDEEIREKFRSQPGVETLDYFTKLCRFNPDYAGNHINWWTHEKLIAFLQRAGFSNPYISGWGQSVFAPLRNTDYFDSTHPRISLYVEAIKN